MKTLVAFSGGLDSTYVLWKLLTTTDDDITACFIDERYLADSFGVSTPNNSPYSYNSVLSLVSELKKIRTFEFKTINVYTFLPDETKEIWFLRHFVEKVNDETYDRIAFGIGDVGAKFQESNSELDKIPRVYVALQREFAKIATRGTLYFHYIETNETRVHVFIHLPQNIKELTFSCGNPLIQLDGSISNCGKCKKCQQANLIQSCLNSGKTIEETISEYAAARYVSNQRKKFLNIGGIWEKEIP
jgi:hypothetical protein